MTQHVDEVAREIRDENRRWAQAHNTLSISQAQCDRLAEVSIRAVVKQMLEPSEGMLSAPNYPGCAAYPIWIAMLGAYTKEAGIDP